MSEFALRSPTAEEFPTYVRAVTTAFAEEPSDEDIEAFRTFTEHDRVLAAFDADTLVGGTQIISYEISLPGGGGLACAGVTAVGVLPTYRRQGVLTRLMRRQLNDVHERGEPLAALYASESRIYERFGYGPAAPTVDFAVQRPYSGLRRPVEERGRVRLVDPDEALKRFPAIHARAQRDRPGMLLRPEWEWQFVLGRDPERDRGGKSQRFHVAYEDRGYVIYRVKSAWSEEGPNGTLHVSELIALDDEAAAGLWQYCFGVDLIGRVEAELRPPDDPLALMVADRARLRTTVGAPLYVRLVDLPAALTARRYGGEGALVFAVDDAVCPWNSGRWRLEVSADAATCERTDGDADLALGTVELASAYLGGVTFWQLARARRIDEHRPGALACADALFASRPAPWNSQVF